MNRHMIIGNLVRDPESGTTENGYRWTRFVVAVNRRKPREGEPEADFIRVTTWNALAENCMKYLRKGRKVACVGESTCHAWIGQQGDPRGQIEMTAQDVEFISGPRDGGADAPPQEPGWMQRDGGAEAGGGGYDGAEGTGQEAAGAGTAGAEQARQVGFTEVQMDPEELPF